MTSSAVGDRPIARVWGGLLLVCAAGVIWGTIGPAVQLVHDRSALSVLMIGAYRAMAAIAALAVAVLATGRFHACVAVVRTHRWRAVAVGLLTAIFQLLFFVAVLATGVSIATVVCLGFAPVLLLALNSMQRGNAPGPGQVLTVATAVVGLLLVSLAGGGLEHPAAPALGVVAALGSGSAYALSAEIGAPVSREHDALAMTAVTMTVTTGVLVPGGLAVALLRGEALATPDAGTWLLLVYLGVATMALAYVLLFAGLRTTPSRMVVVATLLEPVTAVLIAFLFLGERLTAAGLLGALLILAAIGSLGRQLDAPPEPQ